MALVSIVAGCAIIAALTAGLVAFFAEVISDCSPAAGALAILVATTVYVAGIVCAVLLITHGTGL